MGKGEHGALAGMEPTPLASELRRHAAPAEVVEYALVDAFTDKIFEGNPAAVVPLSQPKDEKWMQQVAAEFNLSQTAFLLKKDIGDRVAEDNGQANEMQKAVDNEWNIRWFTPKHEVALCGHGTLASAHVLFAAGLVSGGTIYLHSKSGKLTVRKVEGSSPLKENGASPHGKSAPTQLLEMNFPMVKVNECDQSEIGSLVETFKGMQVKYVGRSDQDDFIVELSSIQDVQNLQPHFQEFHLCSGRGIHVTAKDTSQSNIDFVSRCFFPKLGINEDPVCGSAHCAFTPYWAAKLGKDSLEAYQVSKRGGRLSLRMDWQEGRVYLRGKAATVMTGVLFQ